MYCFHDSMRAVIRSGDTTTGSIDVQNGLRQGCTLAPTLFNSYFCAMVATYVQCSWKAGCQQAGVTLKFKHCRKLFGDCTVKLQLDEVCVNESQFADDAAMYTTTQIAFEQ